MPKGKLINYYDNTRRGLGYVTPTPPATAHSKDNKPVPSHSASSSEWDSDVSVGTVFKELTINMTSSSQLKPGSAIGSPVEKRFEQREPPTENKVIQVNLGSQDHPKPIFISESLLLTEREAVSYTHLTLPTKRIV